MTWNINVWTPNRGQLLASFDNATATAIDGGFRWQLKPDGDTVQADFAGRNDHLRLPPRAVVTLFADGVQVYHGIVPDPPSQDSPDAETVTVLGGREALRLALMDGAAYRNQGVYTIARDVLRRLCPPALIYDPAQIGDGSGTDAGPVLDTYYAPTATLDTVLDALAKTAGTTAGVDAQGRPFLGRPAGSPLAVAYAGQPWRRLTVQGREAISRAVLRVLSAPSDGVLSSSTYFAAEDRTRSYLPATVTAVTTAPEHPALRAEQSVEAPVGISLLADSRTGTVSSRDMASPESAVDGNPDTETSSTGPGAQLSLTNSTQRVVGLRLRYRFEPPEGVSGFVQLGHAGVQDPQTGELLVGDSLIFGLPESPTSREAVFLAPPSAEVVTDWRNSFAAVYVLAADSVTDPVALSITDLALLVVNEEAAQTVAASFLRLPYASPAEVSLSGLYPAHPTLTVTGSPDGDVTGPVAAWECEYSPALGRQTRVRLGSTGTSDTVRAIRWAVRP